MDGIRQFRPLMLHIWPGLGRIWKQADVAGLGMAAGFTVLLNSCLIGTFIWNDLMPPGAEVLLWFATGLVWVLGWVDSHRFSLNRQSDSTGDRQLDLFLAARGEYLRGEWRKSEELLGRILSDDPRDVEARLMLATLMRHLDRVDEAREHLRRLQRLERAGHWNMEIEREWTSLRRLEMMAADETGTQSGYDNPGDPPLAKAA